MEVLFQIVSYIGAGVSLMLGSIPGAAYKGKYHNKLIHRCRKCWWVGGVGPSLLWVTIQSSSTDFYCDWFPRAQNITEYVINLGIRKFPSNSRNMRKFPYNGRLCR